MVVTYTGMDKEYMVGILSIQIIKLTYWFPAYIIAFEVGGKLRNKAVRHGELGRLGGV